MPDEINMSSLVLMHYSIALTDGTMIESSFDDEPVEITMGDGDVTEGMELALYGLKEGDDQTLTLTAEQGFGIRDDDNISDMPLSDFPENLPPKVDQSYSFESLEGEEIPGTVLAIKDGFATIDFNHPLSGQEIVFRVQILGVNNAHADIEQ
ncbi:MAG: FKBP-type peptidyl-prolyl cis-trans isomerase [Proteobacteria bacterium]|nr:FKBP-type peptidyl-prolyl cis-trans isomerase [Pseudomonadota bacterium]